MVGAKYPRFDADFSLWFFSDRATGVITDDTLTARLTAFSNVSLRGAYTESDPKTLSILRGVLQKHDFYSLRLTPKIATYMDGPEDTIAVTRCGVETIIGYTTAGEIELKNGQTAALDALLDDLQNAIMALPWTPGQATPTPSSH